MCIAIMDQLTSKPQGLFCLCLPSTGLQGYAIMSGFYMGAEDLNPGSHASMARTIQTETSPHLHSGF